MGKVAVVYWSGTGNTEAMAWAIADASGGDMITAASFTPDMIAEYDAFAFGCPSMGAEELEAMEFEPMFASVEGSLAGKKVALFGSWGWGEGEWMNIWESRCAEDGITLAADSVICQDAPDDDALEACRALGAALA